MAAISKWPKIGSPSDFYLMTSTFDIGGGLASKKKLGLRLSWVEAAQEPYLAHGLTQKMTGNARKILLNSCLLIFHKTEAFFIGIIEILAPKNIYIDINSVTLTALESKLWHKT